MDIFSLLNKKAESLSSTDYWETESWGKIQDEEGNIYDAEEIYKQVQDSDRNRIIKFG